MSECATAVGTRSRWRRRVGNRRERVSPVRRRWCDSDSVDVEVIPPGGAWVQATLDRNRLSVGESLIGLDVGDLFAGDSFQFTPDGVGGEAGGEEAAIEGGDFPCH